LALKCLIRLAGRM